MKSGRVLLGIALAVAPLSASAQQQPIFGCGTAISCRPLGMPTSNGPSGSGNLLFGVGFGFSPGFTVHMIGAQSIPIAPRPTASVEDHRLFHLGVSLLPPSPTPTPAPSQPPAASNPR